MSRKINFVSQRRKVSVKSDERDRKWFALATKIVIACFMVFLVGLGIRFYFMFQLKTVVDAQEQTRQAILAQEELEKEYTIFAHKLKQLQIIFVKRAVKQEALKFFGELFSNEVEVTEIDYSSSGDEEILSFTLTTESVFTLNEIFTKLSSTEVLEKFNAIQKDSLRRSSDGSYGIQITLVLSGETTNVGE
jgi:hypothetical protein